MYNASPEEGFGRVAHTIRQVLNAHNITIVQESKWLETYHHGYGANPFRQLLADTQHHCRIYLVLGHYYEFLGLMTLMEEQGLFANGEYFVVGVSLQQYKPEKPGGYLRDFLNEETTDITQRAYRHFIGVLPSAPRGMETFAAKVNMYLEKEPFCHPNALTMMGGFKRIRAEAAYLYDAVHLYAVALNKTLMSGGNPHDGGAIIAEILGKSYKSAMGYMVHMDERGDAEGNYTLVGRLPLTERPDEFGLYPVGVFRYSGENAGLPELHLTGPIDWAGGQPPIDEPPCGYQGARCRSVAVEIAAAVVGVLLVLLLIVGYIVYKSWRYEQELDNVLWKIDYKDICAREWAASHLVLKMAKQSGLYSSARCSQISLGSAAGDSTASGSWRGGASMQVATYKGRVVAIKTVSTRHIDITRSLKKELKRMRDLHHDNVVEFVGACVEAPHVCIVTEYCTRGSLKDILNNPDVKLDAMFNASLIGDIVTGMIYLHESPVRSHGNLKTSNCLVDSRWVVKITDFGLHTLRSHGPACSTADYNTLSQQESAALLYRAPELLRQGPAVGLEGTQRGDVYSFAIILYEVHSRQWAWGGSGLTASETLHRVVDTARRGGPYRPGMGGMEGSLDCVRTVLRECWAENPDDRPDFRAVRTRLRPMRKGMKSNIFDNMLALMEQYANDLEALVSDRTQQLDEEKKKTEALLFKMLPRSVAEQLRRGNTVEAEHFDCVTIYFSDIVGFTALSAESTALQIVDFLNDLYTCFDSIIGNFDVYKVETIGDAYMVVSGAPLRNGLRHGSEVAGMSLALLDAIKRFKIRHRPADTLMLRIGLHSGPVCAGVVGQKMPRYCLFGDTVNTAARMESTGQSLRIHCSMTLHEILNNLGGFQFEERGSIQVKGKGAMTTYWLLGKTTESDDVINQRRMAGPRDPPAPSVWKKVSSESLASPAESDSSTKVSATQINSNVSDVTSQAVVMNSKGVYSTGKSGSEQILQISSLPNHATPMDVDMREKGMFAHNHNAGVPSTIPIVKTTSILMGRCPHDEEPVEQAAPKASLDVPATTDFKWTGKSEAKTPEDLLRKLYGFPNEKRNSCPCIHAIDEEILVKRSASTKCSSGAKSRMKSTLPAPPQTNHFVSFNLPNFKSKNDNKYGVDIRSAKIPILTKFGSDSQNSKKKPLKLPFKNISLELLQNSSVNLNRLTGSIDYELSPQTDIIQEGKKTNESASDKTNESTPLLIQNTCAQPVQYEHKRRNSDPETLV